MLAVTRKRRQSVVIHHNGVVVATLTVLDIDRGKIKVGLQADKSVGLDRAEVFEEQYPGVLKLREFKSKEK